MKVKAIKSYPDKQLGRVVTSEEIIEVKKERADELIAAGVAEKLSALSNSPFEYGRSDN